MFLCAGSANAVFNLQCPRQQLPPCLYESYHLVDPYRRPSIQQNCPFNSKLNLSQFIQIIIALMVLYFLDLIGVLMSLWKCGDNTITLE